MLACSVLWCRVLYCAGVFCIVMSCVVLCWRVLYCDVVCCTVLACSVLWCRVLYCADLFCIVMSCVVLCWHVMSCAVGVIDCPSLQHVAVSDVRIGATCYVSTTRPKTWWHALSNVRPATTSLARGPRDTAVAETRPTSGRTSLRTTRDVCCPHAPVSAHILTKRTLVSDKININITVCAWVLVWMRGTRVYRGLYACLAYRFFFVCYINILWCLAFFSAHMGQFLV